jgi:hypothetical protein
MVSHRCPTSRPKCAHHVHTALACRRPTRRGEADRVLRIVVHAKVKPDAGHDPGGVGAEP